MLKLLTIMVALSTTAVVAADWPWLYGPRRNHTAEQKGLLRTWPAEGPKVLWTVPLAVGFGGPAVSGGHVYLLDRDEKVGDTLRVSDLKVPEGVEITADEETTVATCVVPQMDVPEPGEGDEAAED